MTARSARARRRQSGGVPVTSPGAHGVFLAALPFAVIGGVALVDVLAGPGVGFLPVLSLGPALAAISRRPLPTALIGALALACGAILAVYDDLDSSRRGVIAMTAIAGVTVAGVVASAGRRRRERELADFKAIADAAQQILLRPVPRTIPPADIAVRYVSAAASARIGGDLYEAVPVGGGVRLIVGDVLGKGLPAARTAAVVLGAFRESAYDAVSLAEIAARIEASLQHQEAVEEFVTVVLAQVSADGSQAEILNCGHPPPLLVRDGEVTAAEPAAVSLPLGLGALLPEAREVSTIPLKPGDRLLFYTDGITEARDRQGTFYPLELSGGLLGLPDLGFALDQLIEDVLRHVGHTLQDDAAILLIGLEQPVSAAPPAGQTPGGSGPLSPRQGGRAPGARTSRVGPAPALKPAEDPGALPGLLVAAAVTGMAWLATQMSSLAPWTCIKQVFSILNMRIERGDLRAAAVIRETAMRLFAERGAAVTVREIAAAAGVSPGLVIHHYGSKDGLKDAVDRRAVAFFEEMIGEFGQLGEQGGSTSLAELFADRMESEPTMVDYIRRLLLDGGEAADRLFAKLLDATEAGMRALTAAGIVRPAQDERIRTVFLLSNDLSLVLLRHQIARSVGFDPLTREGLGPWSAAVLDVYTGGVFTFPALPEGPEEGVPGEQPAEEGRNR